MLRKILSNPQKFFSAIFLVCVFLKTFLLYYTTVLLTSSRGSRSSTNSTVEVVHDTFESTRVAERKFSRV